MSRTHKKRHFRSTFLLWGLLALAVGFGTVSVLALRHNNEQMITYRDAVYEADKAGDTVKLEAALRTLRSYIYGHMNTSLTSGANAVHPPIQLKYTYERAQAAQQTQLGQNNAALYHDAQQACDAEHPGETGAEAISCIEGYAISHGLQLGQIPASLYKFDFVSAKWSPDLAGWSIVLATISGIGFLGVWFVRWLSKK